MKIPKSLLFTLLWLSGFSAAAALPPYVRNSYDTNSAAVADAHVKTLATNVVSQNQLLSTNALDGSIAAINTNFIFNIFDASGNSVSIGGGYVRINDAVDAFTLLMQAQNGDDFSEIDSSNPLIISSHGGTSTLTISATDIVGVGSSLTSLNASQLTTGTMPLARLTTNGAAPFLYNPAALGRRQALIQVVGSGATFTAFGDAANLFTSAGGTAGLIPPDATAGARVRISGSSATGSANCYGSKNYRTGRNIKLTVSTMLTNAIPIVDGRSWIALSDRNGGTSITASSDDVASGNYAGFLATTNTTAGFTNNAWVCAVKDGTTQATSITSVALDTNPHVFSITFNDSIPNVVFVIDGVTVATMTQHLPLAATLLGYFLTAYDSNTIVFSQFIEWITVESDR